MKLYRIDVNIVGTAYIQADSPEEALAKVNDQLANEWIEVGNDVDNLINGMRFDDPELPEVSLSPAMTIVGPEDGVMPEPADEDEEEEA